MGDVDQESWEPELDELRRREAWPMRMGGPDKIARQHDGGKLTVRERIDALLDPGSFHEVGTIAGKATYEDGALVDLSATNFVIGRGRIDGRPVVVGGDDFTVRGGAADASIWQKQVHARADGQRAAHPDRAPRRRHRRRRQRQERSRPTGRTYVPGQPGLGVRGRQPRPPCRSWRWPSARWPASAPPAWPRATTR